MTIYAILLIIAYGFMYALMGANQPNNSTE